MKKKQCIVAFPLREWLRERATILRCTCIACLMISFPSGSVIVSDHHPDRGGRALNRDPGRIGLFLNYCLTSCKGFDFFGSIRHLKVLLTILSVLLCSI